MKSISKSKYKELFYSFIVLILFLIFYFTWIGSLKDINRSTVNLNNTFLNSFLSAVLIAPLIEEFMFRGFLLHKKWLRWVSVALIVLFTIVQLNYLAIALCSIFLAFYVFYAFTDKGNKTLLIYSSVLFFAYSHYHLNELLKEGYFIYSLIHLSSGLLFTWTILNFGFFKTWIAHVLWNSIVFVLIYSILISNNGKEIAIKSDNYEGSITSEFYWKKPKKRITSVTEDSIYCKKCKPSELYRLFSNDSLKSDYEVIDVVPYTYYNMLIISKGIDFKKAQSNLEWLKTEKLIKLVPKDNHNQNR